MIRIGLISDTHNYFDPKLVEFFKDVDEIWHAGDIGSMGLIEQLQQIQPNIKAVYGNIDGGVLRQEFKEHLIWEVEGFKILNNTSLPIAGVEIPRALRGTLK